MLVKLNAHWPQDLENKETEFHHIRGLKHIHTDSPNHTIMLENTKILSLNGHRKQLRVTEYQQNCFLCLAFIDAR